MFIHVNGIRLYYEKMGKGKPLILVHGNEEDHRIFDNASEILKKHYTLYLIDSRGHGQSEKVQSYHYQDMCDDMIDFIRQLDLKDITYMGSSDGAIIGILLASQYPDVISHLILAGPNIKPHGVIDEVYEDMKRQYQKTKNPLIQLMLSEPHISHKELKKIKAETLILAGSDDLIKIDHLQNIAKYIFNSRLLILEGEDHSSYIIHNDKIAKIILKEIKKVC